MKKHLIMKGTAAAGAMIGLVLLSACVSSAPNEKEIAEALTDDMKTIYVYEPAIIEDFYNDEGNYDEEYYDELTPYEQYQMDDAYVDEGGIVCNIDEVEIEKRQTNDKEDVVYCNLKMSDPEGRYEYDAQYKLYFTYYDTGGWILDDYEIMDGDIIPLAGVSQECMDGLLKGYADDFSWDTVEFVSEELDFSDDYYEDDFIYNISSEFECASISTNIYFALFFESDLDSGGWIATIADVGVNTCEWDVLGKWSGTDEYLLLGTGGVELNIVSLTEDTVSYQIRDYRTAYDYDETFEDEAVLVDMEYDFDFSEWHLRFDVDTNWSELREVIIDVNGNATIDGSLADIPLYRE